MVTLSIVTIVMGTALPELSTLSSSFSKSNALSLFLYDVRRAHAETITEGCRGIITPDADGRGYSFGCDFLPYDATVPPAPDSTTFRRDLPMGVLLTTESHLILNSKGQAVNTSNALAETDVWFWADGTVLAPSARFAIGTLLPTGMFIYQ